MKSQVLLRGSAILHTSALALIFSLASGCSDKTPRDPRFHDLGPKRKAAQPIVDEPSTSNEPLSRRGQYEDPLTDLVSRTGGEIRIQLSRKDGGEAQGTVKANYISSVDGPDSHTDHVKPVQGSIRLPISIFAGEIPFLLTRIEIIGSRGAPLRTFEVEEVDELRKRARKGIAILLALSEDGQAVVVERLVREDMPPAAAAPDTEYRPLTSAFESAAEFSRVTNLDAALDRLRDLASATEKYHRDLITFASTETGLDLAHFQVLLNAAYFSYEARVQMERLASSLRGQVEPLHISMAKVIQHNIALAEELGPLVNELIATGIRNATDLNADSGLALLKQGYPGKGSSEPFEEFQHRFTSLDSSQQLGLLEVAKGKREYELAALVASEWFLNHSDRSSSALLALTKGFPKGKALDSLLSDGSSGLGKASFADIRILVPLVFSVEGSGRTLPRLIRSVEQLTAKQLVQLTQLAPVGKSRDQVLTDSIPALAPVPAVDARSVFSAFSSREARKSAASGLFAKVQAYDVAKLIEIVKEYIAGGIRDDLLLEGVVALPTANSLSAGRALELIGLASNASVQLEIVGSALSRIKGLTVLEARTLARGMFTTEATDEVLLKTVDLVTDLNSVNAAYLASTATNPAMREKIGRKLAARLNANRPR